MDLSIALAHTRWEAGDVLEVRVAGAASAARVGLVRVERRPCGRRLGVVAEDGVPAPGGVARLEIPRSALPSAAGAGCALTYVVEAIAGRDLARVGVDVAAAALPRVAQRGSDPLVAGWDARHFHLELGDASLEGGGRLTGRVHRHGSWGAAAIAVRVRCDECWAPCGPPARGLPFWEVRPLWTQERIARLDPEASWAPFRFDLPPGLPPAVEARTIAWRYELRARRRRRRLALLNETAALTPVLHHDGGEFPCDRGR